MPKNTSFLAPHPEKILIFSKRNDGTITQWQSHHVAALARHMTSLGKPGKGFV